jgi:hypothetical protein
MAAIGHEEWIDMLHEYVRNALMHRLQDKHSPQFAMCGSVARATQPRVR